MQTNDTIDTYDQYADIYDQEVIEFWQNFPKSFLEQFVKYTPGKRVLNVGSGSGRDAILLRDAGFEITCQDGSKTMISITTKLGFESHLADFSEIDFPEGSFDAVWAYTSLIHIPKAEAEQIIKKLKRLLKPSGVFAIGVIEGETADMVERNSMPGARRYFKFYKRQELRDLIESLGLRFLYEKDYQPGSKVYINQLYKV